MEKIFALLVLLLLVVACTKGGGNEDVIRSTDPMVAERDTVKANDLNPRDEVPRSIITAHLDLRVSDKQGNDLLNPASASPKTVNLSKVRVYYVKDGKEELLYRGNLDAAWGYTLLTPEGPGLPYYSLRLFFNIESKEEVTTTILEWEDGHRDVFKVAFNRASNRITQRSIWLNDALIWDIPKKIGLDATDYEIKR